jgi:sulfatase maturation enzyme AslB (radical SAM superfamily)
MKVQSLSIVVPGGCPNRCKFCVARMHKSPYEDHIERNLRFRRLYQEDYMERLAFARDNGCNTAVLTGDGEPIYNVGFLNDFAQWNARIPSPFRWIEVQTSGVGLDDEKLRWLRDTVRVSTISLSLSSVFSDNANAEYNGTPEKLKVNIEKLCSEIKRYDFNLRISLNMTDDLHDHDTAELFTRLKGLGANMVTFRKLYAVGDTEQAEWVRAHGASDLMISTIEMHIKHMGKAIGALPTGGIRYSVDGMSVVIDNTCMTGDDSDIIRYLILRQNCKLYTRWDNPGSILF